MTMKHIRHAVPRKICLPTKLLISCLAGGLLACAPAQVVTKLSLNPTSLVGGKAFTGTVTLSANAPAAGFTVNLTAGDANASVPATFSIAAGTKTGKFTGSTSAVSTVDVVAIQAAGGGGNANANLTINPPSFTTFTVSPTSKTGGGNVSGTVKLNGPAPTGGEAITVSSDSSFAVPATGLLVPAGATSYVFTIATSPVAVDSLATLTLQPSIPQPTSLTATLNVLAPIFKSMTVAPTSTFSGKNVNATVTLTGAAASGGVPFAITSDNTVAAAGANLSVPAGSTKVVVPITVGTIATATLANLTLVPSIAQPGSFVVPLPVNVPVLKSLTISPTTMITSQSGSAMVIVNGYAPIGGYDVNIACSMAGITFPSTVNIASGTDFAKFTINISPAAQGGTAKFTATFNGSSMSTSITVIATGLDTIAPWPKFRGGYTNQGTGNGIVGTSSLATPTVMYSPPFTWYAIESSPAIGADGTIYLETGDGILHGFNPDGTDKWSSNPSITGHYVSSVTLASPTSSTGPETIYVGGQHGGMTGPDALLSLNASNGALNWAYELPTNTAAPRWIMSSPAIAQNGTVYAGSLNGYLYAVDPTGALVWSYKTLGATQISDSGAAGIESSPAIGPGNVIYFGSDDGHLYAVRANGTLKWKFPNTGAAGSMESSPAIAADGTIYIGSDDGNLYAINPNGTKRWSAPIGAQAYYSSPTIGPDGTVYMCNDAMQFGSMFAFNGTTGAKKWEFTQVNLGGIISPQAGFKGSPSMGPGGLGNAGVLFVGGIDGVLYGVNAADGSLYGYVPLGTQALMGSAAIGIDGTIYIASHDGTVWSVK